MIKTIVTFSSRIKGNCEIISKFIQQQFKNDDIHIYKFSQLDITPCGKCNYECFKNKRCCPYYEDDCRKIYEDIINSDFVYFVVPNYCDYPCANYFIFNERSNCYFQSEPELLEKYLKVNKKFIVVSNTNYDNFEKVFMYQTETKPNMLILSAKKYQLNSLDGNLMKNENARNDLIQFLIN